MFLRSLGLAADFPFFENEHKAVAPVPPFRGDLKNADLERNRVGSNGKPVDWTRLSVSSYKNHCALSC